MRAFTYCAPQTLAEAVALRGDHPADSVLMSGGTDIVIALRENLIAPDYVIDLKHIPAMGDLYYTPEEGLFLGGGVTMNQLGRHPDVVAHYPFLARAALSVGSKQVRNRATCVGNLVNASPLADTATPLLCCDAAVLCTGPKGPRKIPLRDFFLGVRKTALDREEIVTGIAVPPFAVLEGVFTKISRRREVDLSTICGTVVKSEKGYRVAFGAVAPIPLRLPKTEAFLDENPLSDAVIAAAAALAQTEVSPIDDVRASRAYRLSVVGVAVKRSLAELAGEVEA